MNLGIGLPTRVAEHLEPEREVVLHSENGLLGMGPKAAEHPIDLELINAGKQPVTFVAGASFAFCAARLSNVARLNVLGSELLPLAP